MVEAEVIINEVGNVDNQVKMKFDIMRRPYADEMSDWIAFLLRSAKEAYKHQFRKARFLEIYSTKWTNIGGNDG